MLQLEVITDLDPDSAETLIEDGIMGIHALYANALSVYPENLSKQVATPDRFRPQFFRKEVNSVPYRFFLLYATERLAYGAASEDTIKRRSLLGWIYCAGQRTLYKLRLFAPLETQPADLEKFFLALPCS